MLGIFCTGHAVPLHIPSMHQLAAKHTAGPGGSDPAWESSCVTWENTLDPKMHRCWCAVGCWGWRPSQQPRERGVWGGCTKIPAPLSQPSWGREAWLWVGKTVASHRRAAEGTRTRVPPSLKQRHPRQRSAPSLRFDLPNPDPPLRPVVPTLSTNPLCPPASKAMPG